MASTVTSTNLGDVPAEVVSTELEPGYLVPMSLANKGLLSSSVEAKECFTQQKFARNLQMFLVSYVMTTSGYYSVYVR